MSETSEQDGTGVEQNPRCDMPECAGSPEQDTHIVKDPSGQSLTMCEGCLDDGWRANVEVLN